VSVKKPSPLNKRPNQKLCPVCGQPSYSSTGIHPQCAVTQSDAPRRAQLAAEKKAKNAIPNKCSETTADLRRSRNKQ